jgi:hypothetical protein
MHNGAIMPSEVQHLVDGGQAYPVVRLTGMLDAGTAPSVRTALFDVAAGQPEAIIVDVRQLAIRDPAETTVLADVARHTADWPGSRLVLTVGADGAAWHGTGMALCPTPSDALATLGAPAPGRFCDAALEPVVGAARQARELVTETCARWALAELTGSACLVATELVNNAVVHARTPLTVLLGRHDETVTIAVRDHSTDAPRFSGRPVPVTSCGGRGLLLIHSVARRWGSLPLSDGKVVWASLDGESSPTEVPGTGIAGCPGG